MAVGTGRLHTGYRHTDGDDGHVEICPRILSTAKKRPASLPRSANGRAANLRVCGEGQRTSITDVKMTYADGRPRRWSARRTGASDFSLPCPRHLLRTETTTALPPNRFRPHGMSNGTVSGGRGNGRRLSLQRRSARPAVDDNRQRSERGGAMKHTLREMIRTQNPAESSGSVFLPQRSFLLLSGCSGGGTSRQHLGRGQGRRRAGARRYGYGPGNGYLRGHRCGGRVYPERRPGGNRGAGSAPGRRDITADCSSRSPSPPVAWL